MSRLAAFASHGGALEQARRLYPQAPTPWIDLSTGVNPHAYPVPPLAAVAWTRLPEAEALAAIEAAATARYRPPSWAGIVAAPGTQAIIQQLPFLLEGRDVRVLGPTYAEYERVFAAGAAVRAVADLSDLAGADVAVVVNPNNPDGRFLAPATLAATAAHVGALVVDEAFMDALEPDASLVPDLPSRVIVLRSFGKFYGLAGLRLGFAVAAPRLADELRGRLGPWAVSGPALAVGSAALADTNWQEVIRRRLAMEAGQLDDLLMSAGLELVGGTPLFRLAHHPRAPAVFESLAQAGILTRPFARQETWLRFGLPATDEHRDRVRAALDRCLNSRRG